MSRGAELKQLAGLFLRLGITAFGGPAAHIAMMEAEVVKRRGWLSRQHFLDLVGATNLIPGPNSTEMAIHIGYLRAGWSGLATAGVCFILPAALITTTLAWAYAVYGTLPQAAPLLYGMKPAILAVILGAVGRLGKTAFRNRRLAVIGSGVALVSLLGLNEILALFGGGIVGVFWLWYAGRQPASDAQRGKGMMASLLPAFGAASALPPIGAAAASVATVSLWKLGLFFLKVGAVLYGSGYVLIAFLESGLVRDYGWISPAQLLDAVAIGQFTPGPVLSTATFLGYLIMGWPGAAVATLGVFLPSFLFVAALGPYLPRMRRFPATAIFLDAVNASSLGLMAGVAIKLAQASLTTWPAWVVALVAISVSIVWRINAAWLVIGGALAGWMLLLFR
jgi:chromate transporter